MACLDDLGVRGGEDPPAPNENVKWLLMGSDPSQTRSTKHSAARTKKKQQPRDTRHTRRKCVELFSTIQKRKFKRVVGSKIFGRAAPRSLFWLFVFIGCRMGRPGLYLNLSNRLPVSRGRALIGSLHRTNRRLTLGLVVGVRPHDVLSTR